METYQRINTTCLFILTLIAIAFVLSVAKTVIIPFILALFIALVYAPIMQKLQRKLKLNRALTLGISFAILILLFLVLTYATADSIEKFADNSTKYKEQIQSIGTQFASTAKSLGYPVDENSAKATIKKLPMAKLIKTLSSSVISIFSNTFLVIIFTLFLLTGESFSTKNEGSVLTEIKQNIAKYVGSKLLISLATGIITYIILKVFSVEMAFMFATLTFLLNFIPTIGSIIAVFIPLPILAIQFGFGTNFFACLILLSTTQIIIGNIIEPKLMGENTGLHPVAVLLGLTFWGLLWGVTGMFLSVPIMATLKIIFSKFRITRPISDGLAGDFSLVLQKMS